MAVEPASGPWSGDDLTRFLESSTFPVRVAANLSSGYPVIVSLWYLWEGDSLWCAMHESAKLLEHLRRDPRCGFEIAPSEPPYFGCRGSADAVLVPERGGEILRANLDRYLGGTDSQLAGWLLSRAADEVAVRLQPRGFSTWDYRDRMADT